MTTDDLIQQLGQHLQPVTRLRPPSVRAAVWLAWGIAYLTAIVGWTLWRRTGLGVQWTGPYVLQQVALVGLAASGAYAAFASVVPGLERRGHAWTGMSALVLMVALGWGILRDLQAAGSVGLGQETDWPCVFSIIIGGSGLWVLAASMLRRGAPLAPRTTGLLAALAAAGVANIEACLNRTHAFTMTVVLWHGMTVLLMVITATAVGAAVTVRVARSSF